MKIQGQSNDALRRLAEKLGGQRIAMLTLREPGGELTSRPLTPLELDDQGRFWFFTSRRTMTPLIGEGACVNLAFSDEPHATWVSIVAEASLVDDAGLRRALWSPSARPWFPGGAEDPDLVLLRVTPLRADVWDNPHSSVVRLAAMAASVIAARPIGLGDRESIEP
jgi:general stress protein 26